MERSITVARRLRRAGPDARSPGSASPIRAAFVRRFDQCFELVYAELRARVDEATAQQLTREVLRAHLDILAAGCRDGEAGPLDEVAAHRLLAGARRLCAGRRPSR